MLCYVIKMVVVFVLHVFDCPVIVVIAKLLLRSAPSGLCRAAAGCVYSITSDHWLTALNLCYCWVTVSPFSKRPFSLVSQGKRDIENGNRQGYLRYSRCRGKYNLMKCKEIILFLLVILMRIYWRRQPTAMEIYFSVISSQESLIIMFYLIVCM